MLNSDCIFCQIIKGESASSKVYEDDLILAFLNLYPATEGHTLIIPKFHSETLDITPDKYLSRMLVVAKMLAEKYQQQLQFQGYNLLSNNGSGAGQMVDHLHLHLIPRYKNDGIKLHHGGREASREELEKLKSQLELHNQG